MKIPIYLRNYYVLCSSTPLSTTCTDSSPSLLQLMLLLAFTTCLRYIFYSGQEIRCLDLSGQEEVRRSEDLVLPALAKVQRGGIEQGRHAGRANRSDT